MMPESTPTPDHAAPSSDPNRLGRLFAEAQAQVAGGRPDAPRTAGELGEQAVQRIFQIGEQVSIIGPSGEPYKAQVVAIEPRPDAVARRTYDYIKLGHDVPVMPGRPEFGTKMEYQEIRADKLALMQSSNDEIDLVSPNPANAAAALRGEAPTSSPVAEALSPGQNTLGAELRAQASDLKLGHPPTESADQPPANPQ
jgi:hypothetical protein